MIIKKTGREKTDREGWTGGRGGKKKQNTHTANDRQTCEKISTAMNKHERLSPRRSLLFTSPKHTEAYRNVHSIVPLLSPSHSLYLSLSLSLSHTPMQSKKKNPVMYQQAHAHLHLFLQSGSQFFILLNFRIQTCTHSHTHTHRLLSPETLTPSLSVLFSNIVLKIWARGKK